MQWYVFSIVVVVVVVGWYIMGNNVLFYICRLEGGAFLKTNTNLKCTKIIWCAGVVQKSVTTYPKKKNSRRRRTKT